jgi:U4/U6 small nuclear ribonucleoprotein PRP3
MAQQEAPNDGDKKERRRKRRWGAAAPSDDPVATTAAAPVGVAGSVDANKAKILAMQESIKARLAAAKRQKAQPASASAGSAAVPSSSKSDKVKALQASVQARLQAVKAQQAAAKAGVTPTEQPSDRPSKKARHYELDLSVTAPTFLKQTQVAKSVEMGDVAKKAPPKSSNPYLAHTGEDDEDTTAEYTDDQMGRAGKARARHKPMTFVKPGKWQEIGERVREKAAKAQESGYISGRKAGHTVQAAGMAEVYGAGGTTAEPEDSLETLAPRWDAHPDTRMPLAVEWWDTELLPSKLKKKVAGAEAQASTKQSNAAFEASESDVKEADAKPEEDGEDLRAICFANAKLAHSRTSELVQHIVPVKPPNARTGPPKEAVLHLTKKEHRRQLKLRRREKQREQQDLQAAGLLPAPEPRLTLQNFIKVLGDQAFLDPSQMEKKVTEQVHARKQAHNERNNAMKLTKEQRSAKRARKMEEDTSQGVHVAVFFVKDMSHPYHRAKVDLNAQQFNVSGGVIESQNPALACIVVEGGPKAIKKYTRLMTVRMKWTGDGDDEEDEDDEELEEGERVTQKFNPDNKCELVWEGMIVKRLFHGFIFQSCETADQARRILKVKGVAHYWDQVAAHASGQSNKLGLKLVEDSDGEDNPFAQAADEDIVMQED